MAQVVLTLGPKKMLFWLVTPIKLNNTGEYTWKSKRRKHMSREEKEQERVQDTLKSSAHELQTAFQTK